MLGFFPLLVLSSCIAVRGKDKSAWTCGNDGYYYENGVKSTYPCGEGDKSGGDGKTDTGDKGTGGEKKTTGDKDTTIGEKETTGGDKKTSSSEVTTRDFTHTWNGVATQRRYGLALDASCSSVAGMVLQISPDGTVGFCEGWTTLTSQCIMVVCPYSPSSRGWKAMVSDGDSEDTDFIGALVSDLIQTHSAPAGKVIVSGFSFGGSMSYRVWCEKSDVIGGIVPIGQTWFEPASGHPAKGADLGGQTSTQYAISQMEALPTSDRCNPQFKRPHLARVGTQDGYYGQDAGTYDGIELWKRLSTTVLGCTGTPGTTSPSTLADSITGQAQSICYEYASCAHLDSSLNRYCTVQGMGHDTTGWETVIASAFSQWFNVVATPTTGMASLTTLGSNSVDTTSVAPTATTAEATETLTGSMSFTSTALTKSQIETSSKKALAQVFSVNEAQVTVSAAQTRRLRELRETRRLAGTWSVSFGITVAASQVATALNTASAIKSDSTSLNQAMKTHLRDLGVSEADAAISVGSFDAAHENQSSSAALAATTNSAVWFSQLFLCFPVFANLL